MGAHGGGDFFVSYRDKPECCRDTLSSVLRFLRAELAGSLDEHPKTYEMARAVRAIADAIECKFIRSRGSSDVCEQGTETREREAEGPRELSFFGNAGSMVDAVFRRRPSRKGATGPDGPAP